MTTGIVSFSHTLSLCTQTILTVLLRLCTDHFWISTLLKKNTIEYFNKELENTSCHSVLTFKSCTSSFQGEDLEKKIRKGVVPLQEKIDHLCNTVAIIANQYPLSIFIPGLKVFLMCVDHVIEFPKNTSLKIFCVLESNRTVYPANYLTGNSLFMSLLWRNFQDHINIYSTCLYLSVPQ